MKVSDTVDVRTAKVSDTVDVRAAKMSDTVDVWVVKVSDTVDVGVAREAWLGQADEAKSGQSEPCSSFWVVARGTMFLPHLAWTNTYPLSRATFQILHSATVHFRVWSVCFAKVHSLHPVSQKFPHRCLSNGSAFA